MTTKDYCLSFKDKHKGAVENISGDQYRNLNLNNQNSQTFFDEIYRPKCVPSGNKRLQNYGTSNLLDHSNDLKSKKGSNSWNKSDKHLSTTFLNLNRNLEENKEVKKSKSANNSTLSLHIAAYENSIEVSNNCDGREKKAETSDFIKKWGTLKHFGDGSTSVIQNPFEFPRQQEDGKSRPELIQFSASQRLLNPNQMDANNQFRSPSKANVDGFRYPWPFPRNPSKWHIWKSRATMTFVYFCAKTMFAGGNKLIVNNRDTFLKLFEDKSRSLLTISNHRCTIDDPLIWALIPISKFFKNIDRFRYTPAAHNICFTKASHTYWFSLGRCVPIVRGSGVFQECADFCIEKLNDKQWIHLFPEGKVTPNPIRIKWGVGRMINETEEPPIVLPIWVNGMSKVWASAPPYYPKFGNTVEITVGEPIDMKTYLLSLQSNVEIERRKKITDKIQDSLFELGGCKDLVKH